MHNIYRETQLLGVMGLQPDHISKETQGLINRMSRNEYNEQSEINMEARRILIDVYKVSKDSHVLGALLDKKILGDEVVRAFKECQENIPKFIEWAYS